MKKVNLKFLMVQAAIILAVCVIAGFIASVAMGGDGVAGALSLMAFFIPLFLFFVGLMYVGFSFLFTGRIAKKTMEKNSQKENFERSSTFVTEGPFTMGAIVRVDHNTGRVAYVSYQNPYEFQMAPAKQLTNIKSSYKKGPLGGTNYVYFEFYYKNTRVRIPTFTANNVYSLQSREVLEGISKADAFCDLLTEAQQLGA